MASLGVVAALKGQASIVDEKGNKKPLHLGEEIQPGDTIITLPGGNVDIQLVNGRHIQVVAEQTVKLSQELANSIPPDSADSSVDQASIQAIIKAVGEGKDISEVLEETAAGLTASSPSYGFGFVNLLRITEGVTPINYEYKFGRDTPIDDVADKVTTTSTTVIANNPPTLETSLPTYHPPGLTGIPGQVYEAGLNPIGSNAQSTSETAIGGTITVADLNGLNDIKSIDIGNTHLIPGPIGLADLVGQTAPGTHGNLTITGYDGHGIFTYSYTLTSPITTGNANNGNNVEGTDNFGVKVTDTSGASASGNIVITIIDDVPSLIPHLDLPILEVHESDLTATTNSGVDGSNHNPIPGPIKVSQDFSSAFPVATGADGGSTNYTLSIDGLTPVDSKIIDVATNQNVMLAMQNSMVTGYVSVAGRHINVFTVDVDSKGFVTLTDYRAVHQDSRTNDAITLNNLITLTATVTDGDGDQKSGSINLGAQLSILDDNPSITVKTDLPNLNVNESNLTAHTNSGVDGSNPELALTSLSQDFSSAFSVVTGADGGSISYTLSIGSLTPVDSKIIDIATNQNVMISISGNLVTGYVSVAGRHINVFTVGVDAETGKVTLTEFRAVHQDSTTNDRISLNNLITLTATVTDGDGDQKSGSINLGAQLSILDDSPASLSANHVFEVNNIYLDNTNHQTGIYSIASGADGVRSVEFNHNLQSTLATDYGTGSLLSFGGQTLHLYFLDVSAVTDYTNLVASTALDVGSVTQANTGYYITINTDGTYNVHDYGVISNSVSNSPIELSYQIIGADGDGDPTIGHLLTTFTPNDSTITGSGVINGGIGDSNLYLLGSDSNDTITGNNGNDLLVGGSGDDNLSAGSGNDTLIGGAGNDILNGGVGVDVFKWELADKGTTDAPATDTVNNFNLAPITNQGDVLNLQDLLIGEHDSGAANNLTSYLHFEQVTNTAGNGINDTLISISSTGQFTSGTFDATKVDQTITLTHVDLIGSVADQATMIQNLLTEQKLITDH